MGPIGTSSSHNIEEIFTEAPRITDQVSGSVDMVRTHQGVLVYAVLDIQTTLACSRCRSLRDSGMEVIYTGIRQSPQMIAQAAAQEDVDVIGLSILSGGLGNPPGKACPVPLHLFIPGRCSAS